VDGVETLDEFSDAPAAFDDFLGRIFLYVYNDNVFK
jgi:hypothetical protein